MTRWGLHSDQRQRVGTRREMRLSALIVHRLPHRLGNIGFGREQHRLGHRGKNRFGIGPIRFGQDIFEADLGVLRKGGRRTIAGLDQLHRDAQRQQFVGERTGEAPNRSLAAGIGGGERERSERRRRGQRCADLGKPYQFKLMVRA